MTDSQEELEKQFMDAYLSGLNIESTYMVVDGCVYFFTDTCYMSPKTYHYYLKWMNKVETECPLLKELR